MMVGAIGYGIDVLIFNALMLFAREASNPDEPFVSKIISSVVAVVFTYLANSRWTFRRRTGRAEGIGRAARYGTVNLIGILITLICLAFSRFVLGLDSLLADNISANLIGTTLAMIFRFIANRYWVFPK